MELTLFSETYLKVKHLLDPGTFVLIHAIVQPSFRNKEMMELKVADIQLLDRVLEQSGKAVVFKITVDELEETELNELIALFKSHLGGKHAYSVQFIDNELKLITTLRSGAGKINASVLLPLLEKFEFVAFELK